MSSRSSRSRLSARALALLSCLVWSLVSSCSDEVSAAPDVSQLAVAESLLDTFYEWDAVGLGALVDGVEGRQAILYYQKWAAAAHYAIDERRACTQPTPNRVECAVTVTDDFGEALGYCATDTFAFEFEGAQLRRVSFVGDDPIVFWALLAWMAWDRGDVFEEECAGIFAEGETSRSDAILVPTRPGRVDPEETLWRARS